MRNEWYGDKRDFLKWPSLLHLVQREGIRRIFQIAMCTDAGPTYPEITTLDGQIVQCQAVTTLVADHFHHHNDLRGITALGGHLGINIVVWSYPFTHATRGRYFARVLAEIQASETRTARTVWFFDPDTGIEPSSGANKKHVKLQELQDAFEAMQPGDCLVCYQHAKREINWRSQIRERLSKKLGIAQARVEVFTSDYASDVIILAVEKQ